MATGYGLPGPPDRRDTYQGIQRLLGGQRRRLPQRRQRAAARRRAGTGAGARGRAAAPAGEVVGGRTAPAGQRVRTAAPRARPGPTTPSRPRHRRRTLTNQREARREIVTGRFATGPDSARATRSGVESDHGTAAWAGPIRDTWRSALRHKVPLRHHRAPSPGSLAGIALASSASPQQRRRRGNDTHVDPARLGHSSQQVCVAQLRWPAADHELLQRHGARPASGNLGQVPPVRAWPGGAGRDYDENDVLTQCEYRSPRRGRHLPGRMGSAVRRCIRLSCRRPAADLLSQRQAPHRRPRLRHAAPTSTGA